MRIRLNIGRRAGEVVEMDYPTAKVMIAEGRATDLRLPSAEMSAGVVAKPEVQPSVTGSNRRRGSSR